MGRFRGLASLAVCALAGCSGSASRQAEPAATAAPRAPRRAPRPAAPAPAAHAAPELPGCPGVAALDEVLREAWDVPRDATIDLVSCTPGRFGREGWLIDAFIDRGDESDEAVAVLDVSGAGVIAQGPSRESVSQTYRHEIGPGNTWVAVDLDRDGTDEAVRYAGDRTTAYAVGPGGMHEVAAPDQLCIGASTDVID